MLTGGDRLAHARLDSPARGRGLIGTKRPRTACFCLYDWCRPSVRMACCGPGIPARPQDEIAALRHELAAARAQLGTAAVEIEHLRMQLAALRRQQYGQSSERLDAEIVQLELRLEDLEETEAGRQAAIPDPALRQKPQPKPRAESGPQAAAGPSAARDRGA